MGIDDCPFDHAREERTTVLGVVFRGGLWLDGATSTDVEIDGKDSTKRLVEMIVFSTLQTTTCNNDGYHHFSGF